MSVDTAPHRGVPADSQGGDATIVEEVPTTREGSPTGSSPQSAPRLDGLFKEASFQQDFLQIFNLGHRRRAAGIGATLLFMLMSASVWRSSSKVVTAAASWSATTPIFQAAVKFHRRSDRNRLLLRWFIAALLATTTTTAAVVYQFRDELADAFVAAKLAFVFVKTLRQKRLKAKRRNSRDRASSGSSIDEEPHEVDQVGGGSCRHRSVSPSSVVSSAGSSISASAVSASASFYRRSDQSVVIRGHHGTRQQKLDPEQFDKLISVVQALQRQYPSVLGSPEDSLESQACTLLDTSISTMDRTVLAAKVVNNLMERPIEEMKNLAQEAVQNVETLIVPVAAAGTATVADKLPGGKTLVNIAQGVTDMAVVESLASGIDDYVISRLPIVGNMPSLRLDAARRFTSSFYGRVNSEIVERTARTEEAARWSSEGTEEATPPPPK